jgi:predicted Zn-dependent peptidase
MAQYFFEMWSGGWPLDTLDRLPAQVQATSAQAIAEVAEHCHQNWVIGLLGDEHRLQEAWATVAIPAAGNPAR